jgi:hypothetical protein
MKVETTKYIALYNHNLLHCMKMRQRINNVYHNIGTGAFLPKGIRSAVNGVRSVGDKTCINNTDRSLV